MSGSLDLEKSEFEFGSTKVQILQGDILSPGVEVEALVSSDDNYLTMGSGVSRRLADRAGGEYVREAQAQTPVRVGSVVTTAAHGLPEHGLDVKHVLHAAVVDYDTYDLPLEEVVRQVTQSCLETAEGLGLRSLLFPAFATGGGQLAMESCARQMCTAIKAHLAHERPLDAVYIILYMPAEAEPERIAERKLANERYIREANLVLGVPYDPNVMPSQSRDFHGREMVIERLVGILKGEEAGVRHAVLLSGPGMGKSTVLDYLFHRAQSADDSPIPGRPVARVTFGRIHSGTPAPFIYRRLLHSLDEVEPDAEASKAIRLVYADTALDAQRFADFLGEKYPGAIFLVDHLERLLRMGSDDFWSELDVLHDRLHLVFTGAEDRLHMALSAKLPEGFKSGLAEIHLECVSDAERVAWIEALYDRYLGREASPAELEFFEAEAGRHPYLISLTASALIEATKADALGNPTHPDEYTQRTLKPIFQTARGRFEAYRQDFFDLLMAAPLEEADRATLAKLCEAVKIEAQTRLLIPGIRKKDPEAIAALKELQEKSAGLRPTLEVGSLERLQARGYLVDAGDPAEVQFMSTAFWAWLESHYGEAERAGEPDGQPTHVEIHLDNPDPSTILTRLRHGRGARSLARRKELHPDLVADLMNDFSAYINHHLHPVSHPDPGIFQNIQQVGDYLLAQFMTFAVRQHFQNPPRGSTIVFEVHDGLKKLPWELILETAYEDELPFRVGRIVVTEEEQQSLTPAVRGDGKIKALLIGDPTDDLAGARDEVAWLADRLNADDRFEAPDVLLGSEQINRTTLLNSYLGSGKYGLIHYSGHSYFDGYRSAWKLKDGRNIETSMLTNALQNGPPALVFSSSCESAEVGEGGPVKFEDQTFDLPSAFLQAGVEAYVGTLWEVQDTESRQFIESFYENFLTGEHSLGECLRRAKWERKKKGDQINWLAYVLYGDPDMEPGELYPAFR